MSHSWSGNRSSGLVTVTWFGSELTQARKKRGSYVDFDGDTADEGTEFESHLCKHKDMDASFLELLKHKRSRWTVGQLNPRSRLTRVGSSSGVFIHQVPNIQSPHPSHPPRQTTIPTLHHPHLPQLRKYSLITRARANPYQNSPRQPLTIAWPRTLALAMRRVAFH